MLLIIGVCSFPKKGECLKPDDKKKEVVQYFQTINLEHEINYLPGEIISMKKDFSLKSNDIQPAFYFDKNSNIIEYVYFNYNSANINQLGCRQLSNLATFLQENSIVTIAITCSYDSSDETEYNKMLSKRRANNVRLYLLGKGIVGERVRINALVDVKSNQSNEVYHYNQEILEKQRRAELEISWSKK